MNNRFTSLQKLALLAASMLAVFVLASCGDETITRSEQETLGVTFVASGASLRECTSGGAGKLAFVADSGKAYYCDGKEWNNLDGTDGKDGSRGKNGADGEDGLDGADGYAGSSCEVSLDGFVYTVVCNSDTVVIDLEIEAPSTCSIVADDTSYVLVCGNDSVHVMQGVAGKNGKGCTTTKDRNGVVTRTCGDDTEKFYSGVCGDTYYDPAGDFFCQGIQLYPKCGGLVYDVRTQKCENDSIYAPCGDGYVNLATGFCEADSVYALCGGVRYDIVNQRCSNDSLYTICGESEFYAPEYTCENNMIRGTYTNDEGDEFKTVVIDSLEWMSEDLLWQGKVDYDYEIAVTLCKDGWQLPSQARISGLIDRVYQCEFVNGMRSEISYPEDGADLIVLGAVGWWGEIETKDYLGFSAGPLLVDPFEFRMWKENGLFSVSENGMVEREDYHEWATVRCVRERLR